MTINNELFIKDIGAALVANGYEPLPIKPGDKIPLFPGWSTVDVDAEQVAKWAANGKARHYVGLRTGLQVGVDIDVDSPEVTEFIRADAELMLGDGPVRYGRPGRALLLLACRSRGKKKKVTFVDPQGGEHAIEILQGGQQFVAFGIHPDTRKPYHWENGSPLDVPAESLTAVGDEELAAWLDSIAAAVCERFGWTLGASDSFDDDERFLLTYRAPEALEAMTPEQRVNHEAMQRFNDWVPELFPQAVPYQGGYRVKSEALGRDLQEDLSLHPSGIRDHGEEVGMVPVQVVAKWGAADDAMAWLAQRLGIDLEEQRQVAVQAAERSAPSAVWLTRMAEAETVDRLERVARGAAKAKGISELDRERLASDLQKNYLRIVGTRLPIAAARKLVKPAGPVERVDREGVSWHNGWYYITHNDQFYRYGSSQWVSVQGFNALYGREIAPDEDGRRPSASRMALDDLEMPVVEVGMYCPHLGERFNMSGRDCVNTFNPASVPEADDWLDDRGAADVAVIDQHLQNLCGRRPAVYKALLNWIAFCVQQPGRKIRHAPLIKGIEGDGKSLLLDLLAGCIGEANTRMVGPTVVTSSFNGFAEGCCVVGLEELRVVGHNRYEATNALKPAITNNTIDIHKKGQDSYNALNVTNYIAFTNYADAVPLSDTDRRWFVIFTPWSDEGSMVEFVGESLPGYFSKIHAALQNVGALRRWLLDVPIDADFNPNGHAPMTPEKQAMRVADCDDEEQAVTARLEAGGNGIGVKVLATACLSTWPERAGGDFDDTLASQLIQLPRGRALAKALQKLGWTHYPKVIRWDGRAHRVWVKGLPLDDDKKVKQALDATLDTPF